MERRRQLDAVGIESDREVEPFLDRQIRPSDIVALGLPQSYSTHEALSLCSRAAAELQLLFP